MDEDELFVFAKHIQAPFSLVQEVAKTGRLPVVNFAAGGIATPADAALMMQLGVDGESKSPVMLYRSTNIWCGSMRGKLRRVLIPRPPPPLGVFGLPRRAYLFVSAAQFRVHPSSLIIFFKSYVLSGGSLAGVFVGSGIFKSDHAAERAKAIVQATTHYKDAKVRGA